MYPCGFLSATILQSNSMAYYIPTPLNTNFGYNESMAKNLKNKKKHLTDEERFCIEKMLKVGDTLVHIAETLSRGKSTITEEVDENGGRYAYKAEQAIRRAYWKQYRKKRNCNKVGMDGHLTRFVEKKLSVGWSPESIASRLKTQSGLQYASKKSIRKFIKNRSGLERFLFWNRNDHKGGRKRDNKLFLTDPDRKWIEMRTVEALYTYGHWEMDFIVSTHNSLVILVCVEKYTKFLQLALLPNRTTEVVQEALASMFKGYSPLSITTDNDVAFGKWKDLEGILGTQIYFCHPYHSWEKGLVENCNRWIREFIPKKTDLKSISLGFLLDIENYFNHKPRECLCGYTAYEIRMKMEYGILVESLEVNLPSSY
jgi:IS30 family transposase